MFRYNIRVNKTNNNYERILMSTKTKLKTRVKDFCLQNGLKQVDQRSIYVFHEVPIPKELKKYLSVNKTD